MKNIILVFVAALCCLSANLLKAQTASVDNKISQTITYHTIPKGPSVLGIFEGRPPCNGMATQLKITTDAGCEKIKCVLTLYRDPVKSEPTSYTLSVGGGGDIIKVEGSSYRHKLIEGKWAIVKGMKSDPAAEIYRLELGTPGSCFYLLNGDENVLFVLDEEKEFRVGNENFSYTLNRVELVPATKK